LKDLFDLNRRWIYIVMLVGGMTWGVYFIYTVISAAQR
jgi:hypothetical protein